MLYCRNQEKANIGEPLKSTDALDDDDDLNPGGGGADRKKKSGDRQPLPKHLSREHIVHDLKDEEKHCDTCEQDLRPIGEETSERYEYTPAKLTVVEDVCKKYACDCAPRAQRAEKGPMGVTA